MEHIFSAHINIDENPTDYDVVFENDQYRFKPNTTGSAAPAFAVKRENDEWHVQETLSQDVKNQAITQLEMYLLSQH